MASLTTRSRRWRLRGHDRTIINIKPEHMDDWLYPTGGLQGLYRIFDDKRHSCYEHRLA